MREGQIPSTNQPGPESALADHIPLRSLSAHSTDALLLLDTEGIVRFANPLAEMLFGRRVCDLVGSAFGAPRVIDKATNLEIIRPDGSVALVAMRMQQLTIDGDPAFLAILNDITERHRDEQLLIESQQFLRSTLDALSAHIAIIDGTGMIVAVNRAWQEFARNGGFDPYRSGVGYNYLHVCDTVAGDEAPIARAVATGIRAVIAGIHARYYLEYPCNLGKRQLWFALRITRFGDGEHVRVVVAHEDISNRKQSEILSNERRQVLELVARSQKLEVVGQQILAMIRKHYPSMIYTALALAELPVQHLARPDLHEDLLERLDAWAHTRATDRMRHGQVEHCLPDDVCWAGMADLTAEVGLRDCWVTPIRAHTGRIGGVLVVAHSEPTPIGLEDAQVIELAEQLLMIALEQQEHTRQLAYQAKHDALTGLPNRLLFEENLRRAIDGARHSERMIAVLFIDLDRFKQINDTLGHTVGDTLLIQLARRFESCVRGSDTLARRGGDEFMLVLTDIVNPQQVVKVGHRLMELLQPPFHIAGHELFVSASIGASIYPTDGEDPDSLQRRADAAMYRAKHLRNNFQFFDPTTNQTTLERLRLENYLRRALERNELDLYYQPKVNRYGQIVAVEALLRWKHPDLGIIAPSRFVPMAEELGLIIPIGTWCMSRAFSQVTQWQRPGHPISVAMNVSIIQFSQPGFIETVRTVLEETGLDPSLCIIELTESMLIGDQASVTQRLNDLRALGLKLAIDDFGTGYSSLGYLRRLPISILKIDRTFVSDIGTDRDDSGRAIINSIINLAHHLGMQVVAEGVETQLQRDFLHSVGCDMIQGFFYTEPLPPALFEYLLEAPVLPSPIWKE
ncbi:EAL and GGDEF domain-containing protein [Candidatus Oscillochloris fontis]|uniref:sensor domain-containing protein n=1 Tax=Candidatus Oscillochloris fontis TaxID=2496868 RepID=UPI00101D6953|nr:EAL domain-containing protein [Candidatus Oscillochloris fontis]